MSEVSAGQVTITLTVGEFDKLLLTLGYATGAAMDRGDRRLGYSILELANSVNRDNPQWRPYKIPEQFRTKEEVRQ